MSYVFADTSFDGKIIAGLETQLNAARAALREARSALASLDHMNGVGSGLDVIRGGKPIKDIIDSVLSLQERGQS